MPINNGRMDSSKILFSANSRLIRQSPILAVTAALSASMPVGRSMLK
ncbi:hypothetical protein XAC301_44350 [Xanthomonas arboricola pv. corylina]|uniref:Uncharacterized protein n=1 Tax=Xanthomonas arboricola pv. corylina TaxID=487821 RepID=A0ABM8T6B4_9XANT|nr:hypothetical protein XAC301_44350 [Xanthomonas arboricola pv. corylina]CAE6861882.1 hypothetical protein XAC301_44350 [Xanthomonas arboricola pv. corylina]SUZ38462.1 hypothetical protein CPBF1521_44180 [Xanthomonas arboricola pv. juglandis]